MGKHYSSKASRFLALIVAALVLVVSSNVSVSAANLHIYLVAESVSITAGSSKKIIVNTDDKYYKATIANTKIATISAKGNEITVKGVKAGTTNLTVWVKGKSESCKVTVTKNTTKLSLSKSSVSVYTKKSTTLKVTTNAKSFKASVANKKIATISTKGNNITVKGVKAGTTTVKVTANGKSVSCKITVKNDTTKLSLSKKSLTVTEKKTASISVSTNAKSYSAKVSNTKIAKVSTKGKTISIKGLKPGTTTLTVKAGTKTVTCKITVKKQDIKVKPDYTVNLKVDQNMIISTNAKNISVKSYNTSIVQVNDGIFGFEIIGVKPGETNVLIKFGSSTELWRVIVKK